VVVVLVIVIATPIVLAYHVLDVVEQRNYPSDSSSLRHGVVYLPDNSERTALDATNERIHTFFSPPAPIQALEASPPNQQSSVSVEHSQMLALLWTMLRQVVGPEMTLQTGSHSPTGT
jgi:hypothetical protein